LFGKSISNSFSLQSGERGEDLISFCKFISKIPFLYIWLLQQPVYQE